MRVVGWRGRGDSAPWKICLFQLLPSYVTAKTKMHTRSSNNNNGIAAGRFACCLSFSISACVVSRAFQWPGVGPNAWPWRAIIDGPCRNPLPSTPPPPCPPQRYPKAKRASSRRHSAVFATQPTTSRPPLCIARPEKKQKAASKRQNDGAPPSPRGICARKRKSWPVCAAGKKCAFFTIFKGPESASERKIRGTTRGPTASDSEVGGRYLPPRKKKKRHTRMASPSRRVRLLV